MIDRLNKPETRSKYEITSAKNIKENQSQKGKQQEENKKQQDKPNVGDWRKFHDEEVSIRPVKIKSSMIVKCLFKGVDLHSGMAILEVDVALTDGNVIKNAILLMNSLDDYFKVRSLKVNDEVPHKFWGQEDQVEIGIPQKISSSGLHELSGVRMGEERDTPEKEKSTGLKGLKKKIKKLFGKS